MLWADHWEAIENGKLFDWLLDAGRSKTTCTASGFIEWFAFNDGRVSDAFANQLGDAVTFLDFKSIVRKVEKNDANVATVIWAKRKADELVQRKPNVYGKINTQLPWSITPAPTSMEFFHAKPERGAIRPYVPYGTSIWMSVFTKALPRAGTVQS